MIILVGWGEENQFGMKRSAGWVDALEGGVGLQGRCANVEAAARAAA